MKKVFMALAIASMAMFAISCGNSKKGAAEEEVVVEEACECCEGECSCDSTKCACCDSTCTACDSTKAE